MRGSTRGRSHAYGTRPHGARGRGHPWSVRHSPPPRSPSPPLGSLMEMLRVDDLRPNEYERAQTQIKESQMTSSYNWIKGAKPTVMIPGSPPVWTPTQPKRQLEEDSGDYFRDENAARFPIFPMEPTVHSILEENPDLSGSDIDILACGSTLGNLLRFVRGIQQSFRFRVEIVGKTAIFVRREHTPTSLIPGVYGFGHTFLEDSTTWGADVKGSISHQRVTRYRFSGLTFLVRFEVDGYLRHLLTNDSTSPNASNKEDRDLNDRLQDLLTTGSANAGSYSTRQESLTVLRGGKTIPTTAIFDLKTRSFRKMDQDIYGEQLPRWWVRQVPNFILGFHKRGVFDDVRIEDVRTKVQAWERENQEALAKYSFLIRKIAAAAKLADDQKLEVRVDEHGNLELLRLLDAEWSALPDDLHARWLSGGEPESDTGSEGDRWWSDHHVGEALAASDEEEDEEKDYTACSAEDCGYCGRCSY